MAIVIYSLSRFISPNNHKLDLFEDDQFGLIRKINFRNSPQKWIPGEDEGGYWKSDEFREDLG